MKKTLLSICFGLFTCIPASTAFAQTISPTSSAGDIVATGLFYIKRLMVLIIAAAVLMFVYGISKYISSEEEISKSKSKDLIINTVIALVAASSLWGLVAIVQNTIGGAGTIGNGGLILTSCPTQATAFATVTNTIRFVTCFIAGKLFPFVIALAVLYYVFQAFQLVQNAENESKRKQYQESLFWGVIFIAVMVSIWALVALVTNTIGTSGSTFFLPQ